MNRIELLDTLDSVQDVASFLEGAIVWYIQSNAQMTHEEAYGMSLVIRFLRDSLENIKKNLYNPEN